MLEKKFFKYNIILGGQSGILNKETQEYLSKLCYLHSLLFIADFMFLFFKQNLRYKLLASYPVKRRFSFSHSITSYTHTQKHTHFFSHL